MHKLLFRMAKFFCLCLISVVFIQLAYFLYVFSAYDEPSHPKKVDAIFVFGGRQDRVAKGFELARDGISGNLIISPADKSKIREYKQKYSVPTSINFIIEDEATNTFENALKCGQIIQSNLFQSVILVTSTYHLPRAHFLLNLVLLKTNIDIFPVSIPTSENSKPTRIKIKLLIREMVKFWGSLSQLTYYKTLEL